MNNRQERSIAEIKTAIFKSLEQIGVKAEKILLFNSRARGAFSKSSDYDFLLITEKTFGIKEKMAISKTVNQALASLLVPCDIIIESGEEVESLREQIGTVVREALKEGVEI